MASDASRGNLRRVSPNICGGLAEGVGVPESRELSARSASPPLTERRRYCALTPNRMAGVLFQGVQQLAAGPLAAPAGLPADPAVLQVLAKPLHLAAPTLCQ